jgi:hypothetical protein
MTINRIKTDLAVLKEAANIKKQTPWDCKSLMMQWKQESTRRSITQKIYAATGQQYEEPGPIQLHYSNFDGLSWQALEFINMSDEEKAAAVEKEFPPKPISEEEAEETRRRIMTKINGMRERMGNEYTTT